MARRNTWVVFMNMSVCDWKDVVSCDVIVKNDTCYDVCLETMCVKCDRCRLTAGTTNLTGVAAHQKKVWDKGETAEMI